MQEITTLSLNRNRFITKDAFEKYLIYKGFIYEQGGGYRSPCGHFKDWLVDLQKSLNNVANFEKRLDTESLFNDIMKHS